MREGAAAAACDRDQPCKSASTSPGSGKRCTSAFEKTSLPSSRTSNCPDFPGGDPRVEPLLGQLGRETRGPAVVAASDGAIEDLDTHRPGESQKRWTPGNFCRSKDGLVLCQLCSRNTAKQGWLGFPGLHILRETEGGPRLRIKLSDADQLQRLLAFLAFDANVVVSQIARDEVEVSFLGSLNTNAQMMQSELRLKLWLAAHPDVIAVMQE